MTAGGAARGSSAPAEVLPPGTVITFYSYKGGTGRSMAVANTACILAEEAHDPRGVLMIDWDLEAPGLHRYFESRTSAPDAPGLLELLCALRDEGAETFFARLDDELARCALPIATPHPLWMIRAGQIDASYAGRLAAFNWETMFRRDPAVFTRFAGELARRYRYVLIDARTGMNDSSGICSMLMPEKLVLVFTPNHQSLDGVLDAARRAAAYRKGSSDLRPLTVFPLASRIDAQDSLQRTAWRTGGMLPSGVKVVGYQPRFERLFEEVYGVEGCDLAGYFEAVQVPHDTAFAYGERVAMLEPGTQDRFSLASSYRHLARYLTRDEPPWSTGEPLFDVVLLHAGIDTPRVRKLADELRAHGLNPWFQETILHLGATLFLGTESIDRAMASARWVALCAGSATLDALEPWAAVAYRHAKPVIPILFEDYRGDALPLALEAMQGVDFRRPGAMESLINGISEDDIVVVAEPRRESVPVERDKLAARIVGSSAQMAYVAPFKVHLCWFENSDTDLACAAIARMLYEFLHRPLEDDAVARPGVEIPVEYGRDLAGLLDALPDDLSADGVASSEVGSLRIEPVGVRLVIALLDTAAFHSERDRRTVRRARARWSTGRADEYFLPVLVNSGDVWSTEFRSQRSHEIGPMGFSGSPDVGATRWMIGPMIARTAGAALLRRVHDLAPPVPRLLFSYSEQDGVGLARTLASSLRNHSIEVHLSLGEPPAGARDQMTRQLERAGDDAVVMAIRTDRYAENPAREAELLAAKRAGVPIVTVLALDDGEPMTSAYAGNHRTLVWNPDRELELAARCTQAWLHGHHFRAHAAAALASAGLPDDSDILPRRPELVDVVGVRPGRRLIVHPDPPLPDADAALLRAADPSIRIATPTTLLGRVLLVQDPAPALTGTAIALSLSPAEDLPRVADGRVGSGITQEHLDDAVASIAVAMLRSGARIAFGGSFHRNPYGRDLAELHRAYGGLGARASAQLMYFVNPAMMDSVMLDPAEFEPIHVPAPESASEFTDVYQVLWTFAMRERMAEHCTGRVLLGGRARPRRVGHEAGYSGPWPGLLEEAWRTLRRGRALYIAGGFGGAAGAIAAMLVSGAIPDAFTTGHHAGMPLADLTSRVDAARRELLDAGGAADTLLGLPSGRLLQIDDLAGDVLQRWQRFSGGDREAWTNGLSVDENLRLFRSTDRTEIAHLMFEGLRRIAAPARELKLALYHGDIASVPNVDGYAVTVTPGVPTTAAAAALSARMTPTGAASIVSSVVEAIEVSNLPGTHVLVVPLELPPVGQAVEAATVEFLARDVARTADRRGLASIATITFATGLGMSFQDSVPVMIAGVRAGRGRLPSTLVFCETDPARYELLRSALGPEAVELRAGPPSSRSAGRAVLNIDVDEPRPSSAGRVSCALYLVGGRVSTADRRRADGDQVIAPRKDVSLTRATWQTLRQPVRDFDGSLRVGRMLWRELLSEDIRVPLADLGDRSLAVLGTGAASELPWELMMEDRDDALPLAGGIVRRLALAVRHRPAALDPGRARLRVLIAAEPREPAAEADAVAAAVGGRADVHVTRVTDPLEAVVDRLAWGCDVLHYIGSVSDADLSLAGRTLASVERSWTPPGLVYLSVYRPADPRPVRAWPPPAVAVAKTVLRAGASSVIIALEVDEASACRFAALAYARLAAGHRLGHAVRDARRELFRTRNVDWGNFLLFGDDDLIL